MRLGIYLPRRADTMPSEANIEKSPTTEEFHTSKTEENNKLDRAAEESAEKASKTEKRYDRDHDIFTK
jgi:hypothetical protein